MTVDSKVEEPEIEPEEPDADGASRGAPWDPDDIRIATKPYSLRHIADMIEGGDLDLEPDFQRSDVWKPPQRSRLIESILLRIPLPSFYFDEAKDGRLQVVDGVQRLTAIYEFSRKSTLLEGLRYLKTLEGQSFKGIGATLRRRFDGTQIFANVIDPQTPPNVKFDVFLRLNTGGTQLNAQEIRHCISKNQSRAFLKACVATDAFQKATGFAFSKKPSVRMADRELALRFFAFSQSDWELVYTDSTSLHDFLLTMTVRLDGLDGRAVEAARTRFEHAMQIAFLLFDGNGFRRFRVDGKRSPLNRSLFESWAVALSECDWTTLEPHKEKVVGEMHRRMLGAEYHDALAGATTDLPRVRARLRIAREILATGTT
jgi:hypothetical protein